MVGIGASNISLTTNPKEEEAVEDQKEEIVRRYKEKISTLPKTKPWMLESYMYNYQGFWYQSVHDCSIEGVLASQETFEARPKHFVLATNPKCGTTWLKALAFAIVNRTRYKPDSSTNPLVVGNPHDYVPFIEMDLVFRRNHVLHDVEVSDPQLLATHVPYVALPQSVHAAGSKIVYICRDPKDAFISRWFFYKKVVDKHRIDSFIAFEEAFDLFCRGISPVGPYWDHVLGYYKASLERPEKVLFLKYEEMKKDPVGNVKILAEFLDRTFGAEEVAHGAVEEIVKLCSFERMKSLEVNKTGIQANHLFNYMFFREGKVGDSTNHLTPEMIERVDQITKDKFHGYDLSF